MSTACLDQAGLQRFVEDRLAGGAPTETEAHVSSCDHCRGLIGRLLATGSTGAAATGVLAPGADAAVAGTMIDRYVTVSELGFGAMGRVYLAIDPELDRKVAIKVLRRANPDLDRDLRLRREAQALARVTHPNVAAIYDVGDLGGNTFLAMEYVGGGTLSAWLRAAPRSWQDIVRVFAAAGRGLAAVHARGLVHRDFKPENVLLDDHGTAKVTDFGLVATLTGHAQAPELGGSEGMDVFGSLTMTGAVVGTPAYMSPEQFAGEPVDARSDQFSFCVALFEALYATRPFPGATVAELKASLRQPPVEPPAERRRALPRLLHDVVARGLALDPARRFPTMDRVVDALAFDHRQRRARAIGAGVVGAAVIGLGAAWFAARGDDPPPCATTAAAEVATVWNPARRAALEAAIAHSPLAFAPDAATGVVTALDDYAARLATSHTQACEATRIKRTQSAATMDLRLSCLARRRRALASYIDVVGAGAPAMLEHAVDAAAGLPSIAECDDVAALTGVLPVPRDPVARKAIEDARASLVRAELLTDSGMTVDAGALIDALVATAERVHYAPLEAETLLMRARLSDSQRDFARSVVTYQAAAASADRGRDDHLRFRAETRIVDALTFAGKLAEAEAQLPAAAAALERGGSDPELLDLWDTTRARIHYMRGRIADADALYEAAIARARARGDQRAIGELLESRVVAMLDVAPPDAMLPLAEESLAIAMTAYGARHPQTARREHSVARILQLQGKDEESLARAVHARDTVKDIYGPDHADVASLRLTVASALRRLGRNDEARTELVECLRVLRATLGGDHPWVADALTSLALVERRAEHFADALRYATEARDQLERTLGPSTDGLVASYHTIAMIQRDLGKDADAEASLRKGIELGERIAPDNPRLALFYTQLGSIRLDARDPRGAEPWFERAVETFASGGSSPEQLAYMRLDLAGAKAALGKWPEVLDLARQARAALSEPPDVAEADALIAKATRHVR